MAIADTVWERLARFNAPYRRNGGPGPGSYGNAALRVLASAGEWLLAGLQVLGALLATAGLLLGRALFWLLRALGRLLWFRVLPFSARALARGTVASWHAFPGFVLGFRWVILGACVGLLGWLASVEMRNSHWQAWAFLRLNKGLAYTVEAGAHPIARFPKSGPYDERLGYTQLPAFIATLVSHRYGVDAQARWSPGLERFVGLGTFPIYREKDKSGLRIFDRGGEQIYGVQFPERTFSDYASMPQLAVRSLLFIEDRYLFDERNPERNPAIEWNRFGLAAASRLASLVVPGLHEGGGSTLATQIEKFRHSPHGVTGGIGEKLRQMLTASTRAYSHGADTFKRREEIVTTYMNSTPLASMPGYGEIIGIPEALWVWFGTDHVEATKVLNSTPRNAREMARKGLLYRQVLSLILSERRPTYYLLQNREALAVLADKYLQILCEAGIIDPALRDAALDAELTFRTEPPPISMVSWVKEKAVQDVRYKLVSLLKLPDLYSLDRLDLTAESSVDTAAQSRITAVMQRLNDPAYLRQAGLIGHQLLGDGNPTKLTWSFVLYERGTDVNHVRIHADSANQPFDLNSGAKLQLGSTAKLRTMITYLTIISELHGKLSGLPVKDLLRTAGAAEDPLTQWAAGYLARSRDRGLQPMLDAAMQRTYSAAPETFFTGGGKQSFGNFESWEDSGAPTVENAFQHSINLAFVRILKDVVNYYTAASGVSVKRLLGDTDDPQREAYLKRFVDTDSRRFLNRFYAVYKGMNGEQAMGALAERTRPQAKKLATVYLSIHPQARLGQLQAFLMSRLPQWDLSENELWDLFLTYSPDRFNLADRGYIAGVHPLELWLVEYLQQHPAAPWSEILEASAQVRQEAYSWLFKGNPRKQDTRIRILLEQDAFARIYDNWKSLGYPFSHLVPSLGTAIGASGDRPDALADLMGTVMNGGVRVPTVTIEHLRFAAGTPYDTSLSPSTQPERVMPPEVAATVKRALTGVVSGGTARRLSGTYVAANGTPLEVGGKTGTGDNRFERFGQGGGMISSRVVDRTATFVFFLGDRFFGTVTAYVPGPDAERFHFTSAIAVQFLKSLKPELEPLINGPSAPPTAALVGSSPKATAVAASPAAGR